MPRHAASYQSVLELANHDVPCRAATSVSAGPYFAAQNKYLYGLQIVLGLVICMATPLTKRFSEQLIRAKYKCDKIMSTHLGLVADSSTTYKMPSKISICHESSSELQSDDSRYNAETEWSTSASGDDTRVQNSRAEVVQRATLGPSSSIDSSAMVYIMALLLPLVSVSNFNIPPLWMGAPSTAIHATELCIYQVSRFLERLRVEMRRLARDQLTRDLFAMAMDVVLVIYAFGFLALSLYQASIIG